MRKQFKISLLFLLSTLGTAPAFAQSGKGSTERKITKEETIVMKPDASSGRTVIEIKDGTVYVNGDAILSIHDADAAKVHKKIIIESPGQAYRFRSEDDHNDMMPGGPRRAMLGVMTDNSPDEPGALVKEVTPGSAAEKAGLKGGDIITRVDGKTIKDAHALVSEIGDHHQPGDKVSIQYLRKGKEQTTSAVLQPGPREMPERSFRVFPDERGNPDRDFFRNFRFFNRDEKSGPTLGVSVEDRADGEGVRVLKVKPGSAAAAAGIHEGDVLTRIGNDKIVSVDELQNSLEKMKDGDKVKLEYQRNGKSGTAEVSFPKEVNRKDL